MKKSERDRAAVRAAPFAERTEASSEGRASTVHDAREALALHRIEDLVDTAERADHGGFGAVVGDLGAFTRLRERGGIGALAANGRGQVASLLTRLGARLAGFDPGFFERLTNDLFLAGGGVERVEEPAQSAVSPEAEASEASAAPAAAAFTRARAPDDASDETNGEHRGEERECGGENHENPFLSWLPASLVAPCCSSGNLAPRLKSAAFSAVKTCKRVRRSARRDAVTRLVTTATTRPAVTIPTRAGITSSKAMLRPSSFASLVLASGLFGCSDPAPAPVAPACAPAPAETCVPAYEPTFSNVFDKTLLPSCGKSGVSCHAEGAQGGYRFLEQGEAYRNLHDGNDVVAGNAPCSGLVTRLEATSGKVRMPPGRSLPEGEICAVRRWIAEGAKP